MFAVDGWVLAIRGHPGRAYAERGTAVGDVWGTGQSVCRANASGDVPWATRQSVCRPDTSESDPWATQVVVGDSNASVDAPWATQVVGNEPWNICRRAVGNPAERLQGEDSCVRAVDRGGDVCRPDTRNVVRRVDTQNVVQQVDTQNVVQQVDTHDRRDRELYGAQKETVDGRVEVRVAVAALNNVCGDEWNDRVNG